MFTEPLKAIPSEIDITKLEYEVKPDEWKPVFSVRVDPSADQDPEKVKMTWEITEFTGTMMKI